MHRKSVFSSLMTLICTAAIVLLTPGVGLAVPPPLAPGQKVARLPAVVLVPGGGQVDRDQFTFGIPIFGQLAEGLAEYLPSRQLEGIPRDEHGHISITQVQLGRMFAIAARRMGYRVHTFSPADDTPTGQECSLASAANASQLSPAAP